VVDDAAAGRRIFNIVGDLLSLLPLLLPPSPLVGVLLSLQPLPPLMGDLLSLLPLLLPAPPRRRRPLINSTLTGLFRWKDSRFSFLEEPPMTQSFCALSTD